VRRYQGGSGTLGGERERDIAGNVLANTEGEERSWGRQTIGHSHGGPAGRGERDKGGPLFITNVRGKGKWGENVTRS